MKRLIDMLQVWLYKRGFLRLATVVGMFGSDAPLSSDNEDDRITLPEIQVTDVADTDVEIRSGSNWALDEDPPQTLEIINFDPTFNRLDPRIDPGRDLAFPTSKLQVN